MCRGREAAHVGADLGQDHLGGALADAGDGDQQLELVGPRRGDLGDPDRQRSDGLVGVVDAGQQLRDEQCVVVAEAPTRRATLGSWRASGPWPARPGPLASSARAAGSRCPATSASSIARPDTVNVLDATLASLMPALQHRDHQRHSGEDERRGGDLMALPPAQGGPAGGLRPRPGTGRGRRSARPVRPLGATAGLASFVKLQRTIRSSAPRRRV
jgi:hypothetical protein